MRGDVHQLRAPKGSRGHEQAGARFAVILQSDDLPLSTLVVAPTSRSAGARILRPTITIGSTDTRVLIDQITTVAPERLGKLVGHVSRNELDDIDRALRMVLALD